LGVRRIPGEISQQDEKLVLDSAEVLFADLPFISKYIYKADKLKWAHSTWAGIFLNVDIKFIAHESFLEYPS
jgi:hypothetical protein